MTAPAFAFEANAVFNESDSFVIAKSVNWVMGTAPDKHRR